MLGVTLPTVTGWFNGSFTPSEQNIIKMGEISYLNYEEIRDMFEQLHKERIEKEEFSSSVNAIPLTPSNTIQLPILADVPAGLPEYSDRDVEMFVDIPRFLFPGADFVVKCIGDSLEPKIHKGDFCVIRKTSEAIDRRPMLVKTESGVCMKVIRKLKSGIKLYSINPAYEPITAINLQIIGLIIGHWSRDDRESWA